LVALMLGASKLLAMAKDTCVFILLPWARCFFDLLVVALSYNFGCCFRNTYPSTSLEFRPLKAVKPSLLASEPSTYTLIGLWCRLTLKMFLITFLKLLFFLNCVMSGSLWRALSLLPGYFMVHIYLLTTNMGDMWRGSPLLNHL
jgi:hypothetical protein